MAKSEIIASLKLNSTDYEQKLAKAKKNTQSFAQGGMSDFAKLATAIASSKAAMEVFNRVVASSQTIGDAYARTMSTMKSITDDFVYSLANADFTRFTDGLKGVRQRAQEAYDALDQLGNTQISYKYFSASERATFREGILTAKDTTLSMDERRAGLAAAEAALSRIQEMTETLSANTTDYLRKEIGKLAGLNASDVEMDALAKALAVDVSANAAQIRQGIIEKYNEYQRRYAAEVAPYASKTGTNAYGQIVANLAYDPERAKAAAAALNAEFGETKVLYTLLNRISDDVLQKLAEQAMSVDQSKYAMGELVTQLREAAKLLNTPVRGGTVGEVINPKHKVGNLSLYGGNTSASELPSRISGFAPTAYFAEGSYEAYIAAQGAAREYADALAVLDNTSLSASEGLGALSGAMGNLSGMLGEGAGAWMNYAGGIVSAVSSALPALEALAAAQAAAAVTKTALSPWTVISGIAAVTSIIAAMSQIPKFATGGVVPGNALSGDNVLIRANSGEVVLTKQQANNIGSALAGLGGNVRFVIEGDKLVGVLNNHNRITSRSYGN